jgi:hypothetical protein
MTSFECAKIAFGANAANGRIGTVAPLIIVAHGLPIDRLLARQFSQATLASHGVTDNKNLETS